MKNNFDKNDPTYTQPSPIGRRLNVIGNICYAYSGDVSVAGSETSMLDFHTSSEVISLKFEIHGTFSQIGQNQIRLHIQFNEADIIDTYFDASLDSSYLDKSELIITPFTHFKCTLSQSSGVNRTMQITSTGVVLRGGAPNSPTVVTDRLL